MWFDVRLGETEAGSHGFQHMYPFPFIPECPDPSLAIPSRGFSDLPALRRPGSSGSWASLHPSRNIFAVFKLFHFSPFSKEVFETQTKRFPDFFPSAISPSRIFSKTFLHRTNAYLNFYPSWIFTHHVLPIRKNPYLDLYPSQFCPSIGGFLPIRTLPIRE